MQRARLLHRLSAVIVFAIVGLFSPGSLAGNMILTVDGITTPIEILSFKVGASNSGTVLGGGSGAGKVMYTGFAMTAPESAASPILLSGVNDGRHQRAARLQILSSNAQTLLSEWAFSTVAMVSFEIESGGLDPKARAANMFLPPQTSFALEFVRVCYRIFGADSNVAQETCWDLAQNKAG